MTKRGSHWPRGRRRHAARLWRGAGLLWLTLTVLVLIGVLVIRLETASDHEDPWEAVVGPDSRGSVLLDVLVAGLLLAPSLIALRVADRLARGEDQAPGDDSSR